MSTIFVNPRIKHAILVERTRIVGRNLLPELAAPEEPITRLLGGYVAYFSTDLPFAVDRGNGWERNRALLLVKPYERHRLLRCHGLRSILIEPESVCPAMMESKHWSPGTEEYAMWVAQMGRGFDEWEQLGMVPDRSVDEIVFGQDLLARKLDRRIARVIDILATRPSDPGADIITLAREVGLSPSRLSHLFREQIGIPIRSFRAWKRMRNSMALTASELILLNAALDSGYADEPHYSRSMRKYFGQHAHLMQRHWRHAMTFRSDASRNGHHPS